MLGAEWTIDPGYVRSGLMFDMARQHGGAMYYTEHRYYGQSFPVNDLSTENLRFLTTEQALEDVANFIRTLKQNPNFQNSRVIKHFYLKTFSKNMFVHILLIRTFYNESIQIF